MTRVHIRYTDSENKVQGMVLRDLLLTGQFQACIEDVHIEAYSHTESSSNDDSQGASVNELRE